MLPKRACPAVQVSGSHGDSHGDSHGSFALDSHGGVKVASSAFPIGRVKSIGHCASVSASDPTGSVMPISSQPYHFSGGTEDQDFRNVIVLFDPCSNYSS